MPRLNLRRYDVQARVSVVVSSASALFVIATAVLVFWPGRVDWEAWTIAYRLGSARWLAVMGCGALAALLSLTGLSFGANSAGQRRNDKQTQSWIGFFAGAFCLTLTILLLVIFLLRGDVAV